MVLTHAQAQAFYDRFGSKQDAQSFYEDAALDALIAHAAFEQADSVFELGCGTGRFALRLLTSHLPAAASYLGSDLSPTMLALAQQRLAPYADRAQVVASDGGMTFPLADGVVDRVVATYVLDLLSESDIRQAVAEARRVLAADGRLCLVSLTRGVTLASRLVCNLWSAAFRINASLVGGCRPVKLDDYLDPDHWAIEHHEVLSQFGVPSEVLVARPRQGH